MGLSRLLPRSGEPGTASDPNVPDHESEPDVGPDPPAEPPSGPHLHAVPAPGPARAVEAQVMGKVKRRSADDDSDFASSSGGFG